jgi:fibronectin type 3 domain-containing protein
VTPADTFPPAAPTGLAAVSGPGVINLIWDANRDADLAGYTVLRGEAPGDTLQPLTPQPIRETRYVDRAVQPGVTYVYAVIAVDRAATPNRSALSNRVQETAR